MSAKQRVCVIIPAYNEAETLPAVIGSVQSELPEADIVVMNDGSVDNTSAIAQSLGVTVLDLPINLGIGGAVQTGIKFYTNDTRARSGGSRCQQCGAIRGCRTFYSAWATQSWILNHLVRYRARLGRPLLGYPTVRRVCATRGYSLFTRCLSTRARWWIIRLGITLLGYGHQARSTHSRTSPGACAA
jgi:glycosyltransferase involved in cell wall biosynthesis